MLTVTLVAALAALLALVNLFAARANTRLIAEVRQRQQTINQAIQLSPLNVQLAQLIANLAQRSGDLDLKAILERYNITLSAAPPTAPDAPAPPATPKPGP